MSRWIVCNKRIPKGRYFCDECLKEEVGEPPKQGKLGLLSWLVFLPFQAVNFSTHWTSDREKRQWAVRKADKITTRFPHIPIDRVVDRVCMRVGLTDEAARDQVLSELQSIKAKKNSPLWAPWDVVFQPGIQVLIVAAGLLSLFLFAISL